MCILMFVVCVVISFESNGVEGAPQAPAMFVFGDAAVDVGNSNFLNSRARANYYPYGVDFSGGASGRSTNGKTFADLLGEWLGMPAPPPFADPNTRTGNRILGGVNYASAGAGILEETGQHYQERYTLSQQVVNFESTLNQLRTMMSPADLNTYLARSIAVVVIGSNDYVNNYLLPSLYTSSFNYNPAQFADLLLNRYARQLVALYRVGLRKFYLAGIGPLGCTPNQLATGQAQSGRCVDSVNQMLGSFNGGLRALVDNLNNGGHPGAVYVYGNTYGIMGDMLNNRARYGFTTWDRPCCAIITTLGQINCAPFMPPCGNRTQYIFWDALHSTQNVNAVLAQRAYSGPPSDSYPVNVQQLANINI
nr:GDSL esterase/lipase At1g71250 [Ipomoea batatas]